MNNYSALVAQSWWFLFDGAFSQERPNDSIAASSCCSDGAPALDEIFEHQVITMQENQVYTPIDLEAGSGGTRNTLAIVHRHERR
jgi:hypothetical protein